MPTLPEKRYWATLAIPRLSPDQMAVGAFGCATDGPLGGREAPSVTDAMKRALWRTVAFMSRAATASDLQGSARR